MVGSIINGLGVIASAGVGVSLKLGNFIMVVPQSYTQSLSAFVAQNIGAGKPKRAKKALAYAILSSLCIAVVMSYLSFFHGDLLARIFSEDTKVIAAAAEYLKAFAIDCLLVSFLFCIFLLILARSDRRKREAGMLPPESSPADPDPGEISVDLNADQTPENICAE